MKKKTFLYVLAALILLGGVGGAYVASADGGSRMTAFVEMLIEKGIIPSSEAVRARSLVAFLTGNSQKIPSTLNAEHVAVEVSQYIAYANRTYKEGEPVEGLLLRVRNTSTSTIDLEGRRKCHVSYKIWTNDRTLMLYDSATTSACQSGERVRFYLDALGHRTFPITHTSDTYHLKPGSYIFELEYPEYGKGERTVTITK